MILSLLSALVLRLRKYALKHKNSSIVIPKKTGFGLYERCNKRLNIIKILSNKKWGLNQNTLGNLSKSLVGSILDYSFPCLNSFSENNIKKLQAIQNTAVRSILKLKYDSPSNIVHHEAFNKLKLLIVSNRLFELSERYVGTGMSHSIPLVERLVKEYKEGFESRHIEYPTPLSFSSRLVLSLIEAVLIRKDPISSYQKLATDFNSKTQVVRITVRVTQKIDKKDISGVNRDLIGQLIIDPELFSVTSPIFRSLIFHQKFCIPRLQNGGGSAGIWRCISYKGTGICNIYTGRINQFVNINTLENNLLSSVELLFESNDPRVFQQDGHTWMPKW
ncbi:hypothetical protein BpHYR1_020726 [Brachionus plicatilis]|uniref:RNA-directed DNA polymerase from mobile element jockey-like n=1 Tax=Brachionus plicatilis TaxID=10195 RepID=A0A3M7RWJ9_BRAPC|nr:hypothetical protein BpHYR1_020726 [Brachionus plicatilis]